MANRLPDTMLLAPPRQEAILKIEPVAHYVMTEHALFEMKRRALTEEAVRSVLGSPEQRIEVCPGRTVFQSRVALGEPARVYLLRVLVDIDREPPEVVTVYRTSKILKYWREEL